MRRRGGVTRWHRHVPPVSRKPLLMRRETSSYFEIESSFIILNSINRLPLMERDGIVFRLHVGGESYHSTVICHLPSVTGHNS